MSLKKPDKNQGRNFKEPAEVEKPKEKEHLTVSLRYLRPSHCISNCDNEEKAAFVEKIRILSGMSWMDIGMERRHGLGYEKIARKEITAGIPDHVTPDVNILAFRFSGKKPMVGYKDGDAFYVLWFDRDFTLYNHG